MPAAVIAIPSSAVILHEVAAAGQRDVQQLRAAVDTALRVLTATRTLRARREGAGDHLRRIVVAATDPLADDQARWLGPAGDDGPHLVSLAPVGLPDSTGALAPPDQAGDIPIADGHPGPDLATLAIRAGRAAPQVTALALPPILSGLQAAHIAHALRWADVVVCAADLSAGHGDKPPRPRVGAQNAEAFDALVADGLSDLDVLPALVPRSREADARGVAALLLAATTASQSQLVLGAVSHHVVGGVGSLVASWHRARGSTGPGPQPADPPPPVPRGHSPSAGPGIEPDRQP